MKKNVCILILLVMVLLALSGCSCSHEWTEAGCETPKICAKCDAVEGEALGHDWAAPDCTVAEACSRCGETRGEALGHDWMAASCAAPETCSRCGELQGQVLEHTFGEWMLGETEMSRTCAVCGAEETAEVSQEVYAQQLLVGHWDFLVLFQDGNITEPYRREDAYVAYCAKASADGTFWLRVGHDKEYTLRWEYDAHDPEKNIYTYTMIREDTQGQATAYLQRLEGMDQLMLPFAEGVQIFLFRDSRLTEGMVGTWRSTENGVDYTLVLAEDHTFTGDVGGEVSGTWYLRPLRELNTNYYCIGLTLLGTRGEEPFEHMELIAVYGDPMETDISKQLQQTGRFSLVVQEDAPVAEFDWVEE